MIETYRKKPIKVEAVQYVGENLKEIKKFCKDLIIDGWGNVYVKTLEGRMALSLNDWLIKEPFPTSDRKFYPCKPDNFEKTYEKVK